VRDPQFSKSPHLASFHWPLRFFVSTTFKLTDTITIASLHSSTPDRLLRELIVFQGATPQ
jgi:hypothetical protein